MIETQPFLHRSTRTTLIATALAVAAMLVVAAMVSLPGFSAFAGAGYDAMYGAMVYMAEMCRF